MLHKTHSPDHIIIWKPTHNSYDLKTVNNLIIIPNDNVNDPLPYVQSYTIRKSVTADCGKTYVRPCKVELQKVVHFIPNFISSSILTINTSLISLRVFNVNNGIPLDKANECNLINTIPCWPDDGRVTAETCSRI